MWKHRLILLGGITLAIVVWGVCLYSLFEHPRFSYAFDIGGGRTLRVWSIRRDILADFLLTGDLDTKPNPLVVHYRVDAGARELVPTKVLGLDNRGDYRFEVVLADGGRLACVYEVTKARKNSFLLLMYDADSGECWPGDLNDDDASHEPEVVAKWKQRFQRLKAEHPDLPAPAPFDK
jgi:hypothetical protein